MFHIKVSHTSSSFSTVSLSNTAVHSLVHTLAFVSRSRENRDLLLLFWLGFFYFTFRDYDDDDSVAGSRVGGKMKMLRDRGVKILTVTDRSFLHRKQEKSSQLFSQLKNFFCDFSSSKNSFFFSFRARAKCVRAQLIVVYA